MSSAVAEGQPQRRTRSIAEHVANLVATSSPAMVLVDDERRYVAANASACRLLGRNLTTLIEMRVDDLNPSLVMDGEPPELDLQWRRFLDRGSDWGTCSLEAPDGGAVVVHFYARAHFAQGLHLTLFVAAEDRSLATSATLVASHLYPADPKRGVLTQRERDVLALVATGLTGVEIAARLSISPPTVESHVGNAMRKLGATNRAHATALAMQAGLISLES